MVPRTELKGKRIVLRPNSTAFSSYLHTAAMESLATVGRWMPWCHAERTEAEGHDWYRTCEENWDRGIGYEFSAFDLAGEYIGAAGLNQFNGVHNFANLGYWVRESRQGEGIASEAASLLAEFGFGTLNLRRIEVVVAEDNLPSRKVAERIGGKFEGISFNRLLMREVSINAAMYSLVPNAGP